MAYGVEGMQVDGTTAQVAGGFAGRRLKAIDVSDPTVPRLPGAYTGPTGSESVGLAGSLAYLSHGDRGLEVIDAASAAAPREVGYLKTYRAPDIDIERDAITESPKMENDPGSPRPDWCSVPRDRAFVAGARQNSTRAPTRTRNPGKSSSAVNSSSAPSKVGFNIR